MRQTRREKMKPAFESRTRRLAVDESGYVMIMTAFVFIVVALIGVALAIVGINEFTLSARTKLMDQSYAVADAGINRAAVQMRLIPSLTTDPPTGANNYGEGVDTPQWTSTETFAGGYYTVEVWQSEMNTSGIGERNNPTYKVVKSTGSITKGSRTAERTILARIVFGIPSQEYDASFDYCIYNGMNVDGEGATWPGVTYWIGNFYYDGYTPYPLVNGHSPKGAIYTRGNINVPTKLLGDVSILGNIVATGNINVYNAWSANWNNPSFDMKRGNIVAGVDGSGNAEVRSEYSVGVYTGGVRILADGIAGKGNVVAAQDVTVRAVVNIGAKPVRVDGIKAGQDVLVTGVANTSTLTIGNITSVRRTSIDCSWGAGTTTANITAGEHSDGTGVRFTGSVWLTMTVGNIQSRGHVVATNSDGVKLATGSIWSGGYINLNNNANWFTDILDNSIYIGGSCRATNYIRIRSADNCYITGGNTESEGYIDIRSIQTSFLGGDNRVRVSSGDNVNSGSYVTIRNDNAVLDCSGQIGNINAVGNIDVYNNDPISVGTFYAGNASNTSTINFDCDANFFSGDSSAGNFWGAGLVSVRHRQTLSGDLYMGWIRSATQIHAIGSWDSVGWNPDVHTGGMTAPSITGDGDYYVGGSRTYSNPGRPAVTAPTVSRPDTPTVSVLAEAGLEAPVRLLEPNWSYFLGAATQDEGKTCPHCGFKNTISATTCQNPSHTPPHNPTPPGPSCGTNISAVATVPHVIRDRGAGPAGTGGDWGNGFDGEILFKWDASVTNSPYSSNETVYAQNGEDIVLNLNWTQEGSSFKGTVVTKGSVYIDTSLVGWFVDDLQELNLVAGVDISRRTGGLTLVGDSSSHYHWWAHRNIDLQNLRFQILGDNTFYGSFTAGNRVYYQSNTFWENTRFYWSRWALDPVAWVEPFKVQSWREM
jgi:hypothetical protein